MAVSDRACAVVQQADAADEPHGGWKDSKVAYLHLKSGSQLIRGVRRTQDAGAGHEGGAVALVAALVRS
jgi:hypothetical protein